MGSHQLEKMLVHHRLFTISLNWNCLYTVTERSSPHAWLCICHLLLLAMLVVIAYYDTGFRKNLKSSSTPLFSAILRDPQRGKITKLIMSFFLWENGVWVTGTGNHKQKTGNRTRVWGKKMLENVIHTHPLLLSCTGPNLELELNLITICASLLCKQFFLNY